MNKMLLVILIAVWLLFSFFVRAYGLHASPDTLGFDEASLGYNAYSIMLTGKDEWGARLPISLRSFDDYKPAVYTYLTIPFYRFLGVNQTTTRLPSAVMGTISLLFFLLLFKKIANVRWDEALLTALIVALLPWRIHFSRVAFEANIAMAFFTISCWFLLQLRRGKKYYVGAVIFSILAVYSYHSARLALPILWIFVIIDPIGVILHKKSSTRISYKEFIPLACVLIFYLPLFLRDSSSSILRRYDQTNIFSQFYQSVPASLLMTDKFPILSILANPLYYLSGIITGHFLSYVSPRNLAFNIYPGVLKSAQSVSGTGIFGWFGSVMFLLGILIWLKKFIDTYEQRFLIYWLIAGILPAIVTTDWFYPLRALNSLPALEIILGFGVVFIYRQIKNVQYRLPKFGLAFTFFAMIIAFSTFSIVNELKFSVWETNGEFQPGGFKESAALLNTLRTKYQVVYVDSNQGQSFEMLLFYLRYPPAEEQKYLNNRPTLAKGGTSFNFGNFIYKPYNWLEDRDKHNFVYFTTREVKEDEISAVPGAKLYKIRTVGGYWTASIITKD